MLWQANKIRTTAKLELAKNIHTVHDNLNSADHCSYEIELVHENLNPASHCSDEIVSVHDNLNPAGHSSDEMESVHENLKPAGHSSDEIELVHENLNPVSRCSDEIESVHANLNPASHCLDEIESVHDNLNPAGHSSDEIDSVYDNNTVVITESTKWSEGAEMEYPTHQNANEYSVILRDDQFGLVNLEEVIMDHNYCNQSKTTDADIVPSSCPNSPEIPFLPNFGKNDKQHVHAAARSLAFDVSDRSNAIQIDDEDDVNEQDDCKNIKEVIVQQVKYKSGALLTTKNMPAFIVEN